MNLARDLSAARSWADDSDTLRLQVRDLARSIHFFASVLGFEVLRNERLRGARWVTMSARTGRTVTLHDWRCAEHAEAGKGNRKGSSLRTSIRYGRGPGISAHESRTAATAPIGYCNRRGARSLWIYDPDGRELRARGGWHSGQCSLGRQPIDRYSSGERNRGHGRVRRVRARTRRRRLRRSGARGPVGPGFRPERDREAVPAVDRDDRERRFDELGFAEVLAHRCIHAVGHLGLADQSQASVHSSAARSRSL